MKMTPEEYSFFAEHIENFIRLTDIVEELVKWMGELNKKIDILDKRVKYLESQQQRKGPDFSKDDDEEWILA